MAMMLPPKERDKKISQYPTEESTRPGEETEKKGGSHNTLTRTDFLCNRHLRPELGGGQCFPGNGRTDSQPAFCAPNAKTNLVATNNRLERGWAQWSME